MKPYFRRFLASVMLAGLVIGCAADERSAAKSLPEPDSASYILTNDDTAYPYPSTAALFLAGGTQSNPDLTFQSRIYTGGYGVQGGYFGTSRIISPPSGSTPCVYASDAGSGDIASMDMQTQQGVGNFTGSPTDAGASNGIALAMNDSYLYAGYPDSNTIGTFLVQSGCQLTFVGDVSAAGLNGGTISGMALRGDILVVAYGDGSIESFNIAKGTPVSNGDEQNSAGYAYDNLPTGVDITRDGHYAVFGDTSVSSVVEVSDISAGKLAPTVAYPAVSTDLRIDSSASSSSVRLSPDESLLYVSNNQGGSVTAAFFDKATGKVFPGCSTPTLSGFYSNWAYAGSLGSRDTSGTGGVVYVAEYFVPVSSIGIIKVSSNGTSCTLTESPSSPALDASGTGVLSIWVYPPRPF
jgi:hypothetical protein